MRLRRPFVVVVILTVIWALVAILVLRDLGARHAAGRARTVARVEAVVEDVRRQLQREARLLAADPAIVEGTTRGDWAALARGASPRMLSLTIDGLADLLLIVDAQGQPLVQIPAAPAPSRFTAPASPSGVRIINGRAYVVGLAPVARAGMVIAGRSVESFARALGGDGEGAALAALDGERVAGSTLGESAGVLIRGDSVHAAGARWTARSLGSSAGLHLAAFVPEADAGAETRRLWIWLGATLAAALGGVVLVAWRTGGGAPARSESALPGAESALPRAEIRLPRAESAPARAGSTPAADDVAPLGDGRGAGLATLAEITQAFTSALDVEGILDHVVAGAVRVFGASAAGLWLTDDDGTTASLRARVGTVAIPPSYLQITIGEGVIGSVIASGEAMSLADVATDARARTPERLRELGIVSVAAAPLRVGDDVLGAIAIGTDRRQEYSADDLNLLQALASQAGGTLQHARLYRATVRSAQQMAALADLGRLLSETLDPEIVGRRIAESLQVLLRAQSAALLRLVPETGDLVVMSVAEIAPTFGPGTIFPRGTGTSGWVVKHREPMITPDLLADPRITFTPELRARVEAAGYRSVLTLPLMMQDRVIGALTVADMAGRVFTDEEVRLAQAFADQAAVAFENARLFAEGGRRRREAEEMARVARTLTESLDVRAVAQRIVDSVLPLFGAAMSGLRTLQPDGSLVVVALGGRARGHFDGHVQGTDEGLLGAVAMQGRPLTTPDIVNDRRFPCGESLRTRVLEAGHRAMLAVPLRAGARIAGVLYIATLDERLFTDDEALLLQAFGDQAALALENARLYAEATQRLDETRALLEVAEILNSTLDAPQALKRVATKIAQVCRVGRCSIQRWDGDRVVPLMSQFADGRARPDMWTAFSTMRPVNPRDVRAHVRALETRRPVIIDDVTHTDLIPREWIEAYDIKSYMVVPLIRHDVLIGVMNLDQHERAVPFEPAQVDLAMAIAGQLALFLENARLYAEARERLWETTTLVAVSQALSQSGPTAEIMRRVAREMTRAFGADMTGMYVLDATREHLVPLAGHHVPSDLVEAFRAAPIPVTKYPAMKEAWREGRAVWSRDPAHDPRFEGGGWGANLPPHSVLFAAALSRGEPVGGMFVLWWGASRDMRPSEVRLIEAIAAQVGLAFENLDLTRQTEIKLRETETLLAISRALSTTLDQDALLRQFLRRMAGVIDADCVGIWMVDESGEWLVPLVGYRVPPDYLEAVSTARISLVTSAFYGEAARSKRPVFSRDVSVDPRVPGALRELMPHRSHLFVPIVVKDRMIGGLAAVWWDRERDFSESDLALSEAIANQAGVTLENLRLFDENRRRVNELSVLYDLSRAVTGQLAHDAVVAAIEAHVARVLDVRTLVVVLRYPHTSEPTVVYTSVRGVRRRETLLHPGQRSDGLISVVLDTGRPLRTDDYMAECARHGVNPIPPGGPVRSVVIVPMKIGDTPIGALGLGSDEHSFTAGDERLLSNIADLGALALSSARLFEDRTRAYEDLAAAQDQLVRTEKLRALGEMASGIAHDFNNLLAAILGRAQLMLGVVQDPQLVRWLQVIERSALDGAQTVRRLQEFTRVRRDALLVPVDLNAIIADALEMTQSRWRDEAQSRGISIEVETNLQPVPAVAGDAAGLREVFTNLILNAVDAMPAGGTLSLTTRAAETGIDVVVRDTGTGMSDSVRERIFDPFFTTKGPQGTGLGLAMTYGIVSRHGAAITVASGEGEGSTFGLTFPLAHVTPAAPPALEPPPPAAAPAMRCLVVDDEEAVGMVLGDVLEMSGHAVVVLTDGAAAIERFRAEPFDVVFTDLAMPGVSGWQVIRAVKAIAPTVPVFLVTGFGVELSADERRAHGVEAVLAKPLKIEDLLAAVSQAARKRAQTG